MVAGLVDRRRKGVGGFKASNEPYRLMVAGREDRRRKARFCLQPLGHRSNHHQLAVAGQFPIISYNTYTIHYYPIHITTQYTLQYITTQYTLNTHL
ncbi:hypothetical protein BLOT_015372 [Blomia tropicalis]|nr:hypothetical protein BLOT_015372 [Blomia tropicalis]